MKGETTLVPVLDQLLAQAAVTLCGRAGTGDIVDATVALIAKLEHAVVITSDVEDIRRLDSTLAIEKI